MGAVAGSISSQRDNLHVRRNGRGALESAKRLLRSDRRLAPEGETVTVRVNFLPMETMDETSSMSMDTETAEEAVISGAAEDHGDSTDASFKSWHDEQSLFAAENEALGDPEKENTPFVRFTLAGRFVTEDEALPGYLSESDSDDSETTSTAVAISLPEAAVDSMETRSVHYRKQRRRYVHDSVVTETRPVDEKRMDDEQIASEWVKQPVFTTGSRVSNDRDRGTLPTHAVDLVCGESWQRQRVTAPEPSELFFWENSAGSASSITWSCLPTERYPDDEVNVVPVQQAARHLCLPDSTIMLFDWDDTLLSSTWLSSMGHRVDDSQALPPELSLELEELEDLVIGILKDAQRYGRVCVVTNAETGWVQLSAARFMPRVLRHLDASDIRIISARSVYEMDFPNSPSDWKTQAFKAELEKHPKYPDSLNLLVLGDSVSERDAAHAVRRHWLHDGLVKTVKFVERPTLEQLRRQLGLIQKALPHICAFEGSFDVNLAVD